MFQQSLAVILKRSRWIVSVIGRVKTPCTETRCTKTPCPEFSLY